MKYAITGSTGKFGQEVIKTLLNKVNKNDIVALARNQAKAEKLLPAGIDIRPGSYEDVDALTDSLKGIDRLLFISSQPGGKVSRLEQHKNVIEAAKNAGVKYIAYTSFPKADQATAPLAEDHQATEILIIEAGFEHSFLRNNWYLENEMSVIQAGKDNKPFVYAAGNGRAGWALEKEYAQAAANVLVTKAPKNIYEFAGPSHTYADLAQALKKATGNDFAVQSITAEQYQQGLLDSGMDQATAELITSFQTLIRDGNLDEDTSDLTDVLGHDLPSLENSLKEVLAN